MHNFAADYRAFDASNFIDIYKYLMKKIWYEIMYGLIKKMVIVLISSIVNSSNHTKYILLIN